MAVTAGTGALGCATGSGGSEAKDAPTAAEDEPADPLDAALRRLHGTDPEFKGGLSNHGPMAAEALEALGAPERIAAFVEGYAERLEPMSSAEPVSERQWSRALGQPGARAGWIAYFEQRLAENEPQQVVAEAAPRLASGVAGAAFHGLLRAGHAFRAWGSRESEPRRAELAHGLGYWAARHLPLPGEPGRRAERGQGPLATLARTPLVEPSDRARGGLIFTRFAVLEGREGFVRAVETYDPDAMTPDEALDELALVTARAYLASSGGPRFVYLHGITSTAALRLLLPALPEDAQRTAVAHQVAAIAAVHATHGDPSWALDHASAAPSVEPAAIVQQAISSDDDHTIKLVEAALREHRRRGAPELHAVAAHRVGLG